MSSEHLKRIYCGKKLLIVVDMIPLSVLYIFFYISDITSKEIISDDNEDLINNTVEKKIVGK